jgi:hypothetical protein
MKKISMLMMAALAVTTLSCNKENAIQEEENQPVHRQTLVAQFADEETKTFFDGTVFKWNADDKILVRSDNAAGYTVFDNSTGESAGAVTFEAETDDTICYGDESFALYPNSTSDGCPKIEETILKIYPEPTYTWSEGAVQAPMIAKVVSGENLEFTHLGGLLKVTYKNVPPKARYIKVTAPIDATHYYKISQTMGPGGFFGWEDGVGFTLDKPYIKAYNNGKTNEYFVRLDINAATPAQRASDDGITAYIPLPVGPNEGGVYPTLKVSLTFADGTTVPGSDRTATNIPIQRAHIKPMPAITLTKYKLTTLIGSAGRAANTSSHVTGSFAETKLYAPRGMVMLPDNKAVVFDQNDAVMFVDLNVQTVEKVSYNSGTAVPWGGCYHGGVLYIVDKSLGRFYTCSNLTTKEITYSNISTGNYSPMMIQFSGSDAYVVIRDAYGLFKYEGGITGTKTKFADFNSGSLSKVKPISFTVDGNGDFIIATADNGFKLFKESSAGGAPVAVAGNGTKATNYAALVDGPVSTATFTANTYGLAFDGDGNLYVGDGFAIRKITFGPRGWDDAVVTTIITNGTNTPKDGYGADAALNCVGSMAFNSDYSKLYVTDQNAGKVYVVTIE